MSDLWIKTGKGRMYILGDDAVEMIVPPGYKLRQELIPAESLPSLPPIVSDMSEEEAEAIRKEIEKNAELRRKLGVPPMEGM